MENEHESSTLHARRKRSPIGKLYLSSCFHADHHHHRRRASSLFDFSSNVTPSPNRRSPSSWIRTKHFIPRMGKHRRHSSADFSYDPLSYALNFEDTVPNDTSEGEDPTRNFSSRLEAATPSPPRPIILASAPSPGKMLSVSRGTSDQLRSSRTAAAAEVIKNLELSSPSETRRNPEYLPAPRRQMEVTRTSASEMPAELRKHSLDVSTMQKKLVPIAEKEEFRSIERSTTRVAAAGRSQKRA